MRLIRTRRRRQRIPPAWRCDVVRRVHRAHRAHGQQHARRPAPRILARRRRDVERADTFPLDRRRPYLCRRARGRRDVQALSGRRCSGRDARRARHLRGLAARVRRGSARIGRIRSRRFQRIDRLGAVSAKGRSCTRTSNAAPIARDTGSPIDPRRAERAQPRRLEQVRLQILASTCTARRCQYCKIDEPARRNAAGLITTHDPLRSHR